MRMRIVFASACAVAAAGMIVPVAAQPSGETVAVDQAASASGPPGTRILEADAPIYMGDLITTDEAGQAQIRFADDTRMVVGPNSEMTIDRFVFAGQSTAREFTIDAVRGAFRFITGSSPKEAYTIRTQVATIGVRGTAFDATLLPDGTGYFALYDNGELEICYESTPRRCAIFDDRCDVIVMTADGEFEWQQELIARTEFMDENFPFAFKEGQFAPGFRADSNACEYRDLTGPPREGQNPERLPGGGGGGGDNGDIIIP